MIIGKDKFVAVIYELKTELEGELIEKATEETPLTYIAGSGLMLPRFESNLEGLKKGDSFEFKIETEEAYGLASEEAVIELPKNIFEVDGKIDTDVIKEGNVVPMQDSSGRKMNGLVLDVTEDNIKIDFNHPLAGDDLFFSGEVVEVRDASTEELAALQGGGSSCSSGGCGDSCGSGCGDEESSSCGDDKSSGCGCGC